MQSTDEIIEGLQILRKYGEVEVQGDLDTIYAGFSTEDVKVPELDLERLKRIGWHGNPDDCFSHYAKGEFA